MTAMAEDANPGLRASGLGVVGDIPWGTHFCQFYQSKDDLLDILVPYLKAGLENNEFCMWVVSEPLGESEAKAALRQAVPQLDRYLSQGQLEIIPHTAWYLIDGVFESRRVLAGWAEKLQKGLAKGYDGLRLTGNTLWLESKDWSDFVAYEAEVDRVISDRRMIALCTYSLGACSATEIIDVVNNHQFALARRDGCWELVESAARRQATQSLRASEARLRQLNRTLTALRNSNKALARAADEAEYLKEVCRIVQQDCGHAMAWIGYAHDDAGKTVRSVACAGLDEGYLESARITWADTERGRGPTGTAIRTGKPQGCANTLTDPIFAPWRAEAAKRGYASSLVLPLLDRGRAFGALTIYSKEPGAFAQDQARALSDLADDVASGIMTLRLRAERERAEAVIAQSLRRFELLAQTAGELLRSPDPQKSVESLCRKVMEHLDCHVFFNFLSEPEKDPGSDCPGARLHLNACAGIPESEARKIEWLDYGAAICGRAARDACRIVAERISTTPDPRAELVKSYGIKAYASHPLLGIEGEVIGTLSFGTRSRETFSPDDLSLMQAVADQVATAMVRTKGERQLRQAKEDWERTFDAVPDLISILDKDSRIVQVNRAMAERLAISPEQCVGKPCHEAVHGLARPPASCPHILTCRDGKPHTAEIREERLDGDFLVSTTPLLDSQGRKTGAVHVARDITERKRAEAEMARLAAFPLHNPNPVAETDADGRIHLLNPAAETLLPDLRQKGRAHPWLQDWEAVIAELRSDPKRTILRDIAIGGRSYEQSLRLIVQTGHVHIYGQDITARKQAEAALQELNNELEQKVEERTKGIREAEAEKLKLRTQFLQAQKMEAVG
ncbi:MAG TPA: hypothetical protein DEB40_04020, partial [Elusimicrobia bacterium]|nr:hypothetical protein [Elusimicrobiota bacterium]